MTQPSAGILEKAHEWFFSLTDPVKRMENKRNNLIAQLEKDNKEHAVLQNTLSTLTATIEEKSHNMIACQQQGLEAIAHLVERVNATVAAMFGLPTRRRYPIDEINHQLINDINRYLDELNEYAGDPIDSLSFSSRKAVRKQYEQLYLRLSFGLFTSLDHGTDAIQQTERTDWTKREKINDMVDVRKENAQFLFRSIHNFRKTIQHLFPETISPPESKQASSWWPFNGSTNEINRMIDAYHAHDAACDKMRETYYEALKKYQKAKSTSDQAKELICKISSPLEGLVNSFEEEIAVQREMELARQEMQKEHYRANQNLDEIYNYLQRSHCRACNFPNEKEYSQSGMDPESLQFPEDCPDSFISLFKEGHILISKLLANVNVTVPADNIENTLYTLQNLCSRLVIKEIKEYQLPFPKEAKLDKQADWFLRISRYRQLVIAKTVASLAQLKDIFTNLFPPDKQEEKNTQETIYSSMINWFSSEPKTGYEKGKGPKAIHQLILSCFEVNTQADVSGFNYFAHIRNGYNAGKQARSLNQLIVQKLQDLKNLEESLALHGRQTPLTITYYESEDSGTGNFNESASW